MYDACAEATRLPFDGFASGAGQMTFPVAVADLLDHVARHQQPAVRDRAVGADHVDRVDLDRPDALRDHRAGVGRVADAHLLGPLELVLETVDEARLDGRHVERELEGGAEPDGTALQAVRLRRPEGLLAAPREVGRGIDEQRRRGHRLVVETDQVVEGLDRRPGLAPAVLEDVELRLELVVAGRRVRGGAAVREDLARPVVDDRPRPRYGCSGSAVGATSRPAVVHAVGFFIARYTAAGLLLLGPRAAAKSHFSTMRCIR